MAKMQAEQELRFGPYRFDVANGQLWRDTARLELPPKALAVLSCLITQPGQLVTKDALLETVWPNVVVSDGVLAVCIREIRKVLGEKPKPPQYLQTVHRRGYRFIGALQQPEEEHRPADNQAHLRRKAAAFQRPFVGWESELEQVQALAEEQLALATEHGFALWLANGTILRGWALTEQERIEEGIRQLGEGLEAHVATGAELALPYWHSMLGEAHRKKGEVAAGLAVVADAVGMVDRTGERRWEAELYRLKGKCLLEQAVPDQSRAESCFSAAVEITRHQQAKALELRAAMSLAELWQQQGRCDDARNLLAPVYGWFTEGFETADLQDASALLAGLA